MPNAPSLVPLTCGHNLLYVLHAKEVRVGVACVGDRVFVGGPVAPVPEAIERSGRRCVIGAIDSCKKEREIKQALRAMVRSDPLTDNTVRVASSVEFAVVLADNHDVGPVTVVLEEIVLVTLVRNGVPERNLGLAHQVKAGVVNVGRVNAVGPIAGVQLKR